ncbi:MAG: efflux RND transporter periplasmic adaptor subunit [Planctomycetota bacterium]|jgi:multidrug efflux pump subunit AcrA (membrane-fusion protein)
MTKVDVKQLAIDRTEPASGPGPPRHLWSRYVLPLAILLGFALTVLWAARDRLLPSRQVTVVPVIATRAEVRNAGAPLFQAPGWIEPRPTAVVVSALAEGVVKELLVVEGQDVEADQPVARLIDADAKLALDQARAELDLKKAELDSARAELDAARLWFEKPVHLEAALAEADHLLAQAERELASLPFTIRAAEARFRLAERTLERRQSMDSTIISKRLLQESESALETASSQLEELERREVRLKPEIDALRRKRDALSSQLDLKIDEARALAEAEAKLKGAQAKVRQAELAVDAAELELERMVVRAPEAGRVLRLSATPGKRVAGLSPHSLYDASAVVSLYDPRMLQVRCDVRLEDVPLVEPGQPVRIETASSAKPIEGEVLLATSWADVRKHTLEVKVAVKSPPATIRPEMLVQATFLAPERPASQEKPGQERLRLLVPGQLVDRTPDGDFVWIAGPQRVARRRHVTLGTTHLGELVEVTQGLKTTDKLIFGGRESLEPNERIRVIGEDASLGIAMAGSSEDVP